MKPAIPEPLRSILMLARWAPTGDNVQPHQFEIVAPDHVVVHAHDTRDDTVYDLDGRPSQLAVGALLETMALAAAGFGLRADAVRRPMRSENDQYLEIDVRFVPDAAVSADPRLIQAIEERTVQRRRMQTRPLTAQEKAELAAAVGPGYQLTWHESLGQRWRMARLMYRNARLRLTMPEAYEVHRRIIVWNAHEAKRYVPDQALGVDAMTLKLMKWAMVSWKRLARMNALMGTSAPRLQMDLLPGLACAAHVAINAQRKPETVDDYIAAGRATQRFWLTLTRLGLFLQPEMTPLIFSRYVNDAALSETFTAVPALRDMARALERESAALLQTDRLHPVFLARVGAGERPSARSKRLDLEDLLRN